MILFISDLHLDASRPQITQAFYQFLSEHACKAEALYILGDFFELWVGDDDDSEYIHEIETQLKAFTDSGIPVYFIHGNRDFLIGNAFVSRTGVQLLDDPTVIQLGDTKVVLSHGDMLCTQDTAYQTFRQQTRNRDWQQAVLTKSLAERREIARQMRLQSKTMSSSKAIDIMDVSENAVLNLFADHNADMIIHGHTHRPDRHIYSVDSPVNSGDKKERIVLGDWDEQAWCLTYDQNQGEQCFHLESWDI